MTTPEQKARELHDRISIRHAHHKLMNPSDEQLQELANLIAERDALKAELEAIKGAGERAYCFAYEWDTPFGAVHRSLSPRPYDGNAPSRSVPLYTRPCVPLTDEPELLEALKRLLFAAQTTGGVAGRDEGLCAAIDAATAVIAKVVAHTKGAKG